MFSERILVVPLVEADLDLKFDKQGAFSGVANFWLAHGSASAELNLVGSIQQSLNVSHQILVPAYKAAEEFSVPVN